MTVHIKASAAATAAWFAELDQALGDARRLLQALGASEGQFRAIQLSARIEALRREIHAMRLRKRLTPIQQFAPIWSRPPARWDDHPRG